MTQFELIFWTLFSLPLVVLAIIAAVQYRRDEEVSDLVAGLLYFCIIVWLCTAAVASGLAIVDSGPRSDFPVTR